VVEAGGEPVSPFHGAASPSPDVSFTIDATDDGAASDGAADKERDPSLRA
jgi:hypothetical protein